MVAGLQGCKAAGEQSRAEAGVVAAPRREAQRMAVQAERSRGWLCRERGPEAETSLLHAHSL